MQHRSLLIASIVIISVCIGFYLHPLLVLVARQAPQHVEGQAPSITTNALSKSVNVSTSIMMSSASSRMTQIEICGYGKVIVNGKDTQTNNPELEKWLKPAMDRWRTALLSSDRSQSRAVGLLLQSINPGTTVDAALGDQPRDDLVRLAVGTHEPAVYAIATRICNIRKNSTETDMCQSLSIRGWTQIDPENAIPWLLLANEAHAQGDVVTETDAYRHAAAANAINTYGDKLYGYAKLATPDDVSPIVTMQASVELIGVEAAWPRADYSALFDHCSAKNLIDDTVRKNCSQLAELYVDKGTSLLDLGLGIKVGERAGWPKSRIATLNQQYDALREVRAEQVQAQYQLLSDPQLLSCSSIQRFNDFQERVELLDERAAAQEALDRSGQTIMDMAQKQIAKREEVKRNADKQRESESSTLQ